MTKGHRWCPYCKHNINKHEDITAHYKKHGVKFIKSRKNKLKKRKKRYYNRLPEGESHYVPKSMD